MVNIPYARPIDHSRLRYDPKDYHRRKNTWRLLVRCPDCTIFVIPNYTSGMMACEDTSNLAILFGDVYIRHPLLGGRAQNVHVDGEHIRYTTPRGWTMEKITDMVEFARVRYEARYDWAIVQPPDGVTIVDAP